MPAALEGPAEEMEAHASEKQRPSQPACTVSSAGTRLAASAQSSSSGSSNATHPSLPPQGRLAAAPGCSAPWQPPHPGCPRQAAPPAPPAAAACSCCTSCAGCGLPAGQGQRGGVQQGRVGRACLPFTCTEQAQRPRGPATSYRHTRSHTRHARHTPNPPGGPAA